MPSPDEPAEFWNEKFDRPDYRYGTEPNAFVADVLPQLLTPGDRVLCVGDGEGRNGVWAARQGFETTSLEPSSVGIEKTEKLAAEYDVDVETVEATFPSDEVDDESFDAVVLTYVHTAPEDRPVVHRACVEALKPGGIVVLEGFHPDQRRNGRDSGGPPDPAMMFTAEMLEEDFEGLEFEILEERTVELDEGDGHTGPADVVRMVGRK